jgi:beta-lactamase regulating signal transducer with metallopeptidase domain
MNPNPLDLLGKVVLLLCAAFMLSLALRRQSASLRSLVWTLALGGVLALPLLSWLTPPLHVGILPTRGRPEAVARSSDPLTNTPRADQPSSAQSVHAESPELGQNAVESPATPIAEISATSPISWPTVALLTWVLGFGLFLIRMLVNAGALGRIVRSSRLHSSAEWQQLVAQVRRELGIGRPVSVRVSDAITIPAVAGAFRAVLLLPAESDEWDDSERRQVVLHELAHVARWDGLSQLISHLACAVYWPLPFVWMAARRAAELRELACDNVVLRSGARPSIYAENLLRIVRSAGSSTEVPRGVLAMAHPSRLHDRVKGILDPTARREAVNGRTTVLVMGMAAGVFGIVAAMQPGTRIIATPGIDVSGVERAALHHPSTAQTPAGLSGSVLRSVSTVTSASDTNLFCSRGVSSSSSSMNEDDDHNRSWTVKITGSGCKVDMRVEGKVEFTDDFTDVRSISNGGFFRLDATDHGVRHQLEIQPRNGALERTWRVDGTERPFDQDAQRWFATFLIQLDRSTAIAVDTRLPQLLKQGGVTAVLNETALMPSDYARSQYYTKLAAAARLSPQEVKRIFDQAVSLKTSDYYASELLKAFLGNGVEDPAMRAVVLSMVDQMSSDYYRAEAMNTLLGSGHPTGNEMDVLLTVVGRMESSYYQAETLKKLLSLGSLTPAQRSAVANTVAKMKDDYQMSEVLKVLVSRGTMTDAERQAFFAALAGVRSDYYLYEITHTMIAEHQPSSAEAGMIIQSAVRMESDYYRGEIASDVLSASSLTSADLLSVVELARKMESDYTKGAVLQKVLQHQASDDRVRRAVLDVANSMSDYYRGEVRRSAGQG